MTIDAVLARLDKEGRQFLTEHEAATVLTAHGIPLAKSELCPDLAAAKAAAQAIGYPVVLKVVSPDILHKTEAGCVQIGIKDDAELEKAWERLLSNAAKYKPAAAIHGILVQQMVKTGTEIIIGVKNDEQFGPVVVFGLGGIFVEILDDVSMRLLPFDRADAVEMIRETKAWQVLQGVRGSAPCDVEALLDVLEKLSAFIASFPRNIAELDMNPVFVYPKGQGCVAVDALITLNK